MVGLECVSVFKLFSEDSIGDPQIWLLWCVLRAVGVHHNEVLIEAGDKQICCVIGN